ncbi:hypothetical protein EDD75_0579 [Thermodesulfitimonas autotrophica]|uniref:Uncharacterized protein n=1 Tax=Thermodesulfitimonas autotrophica TaxID=1894989 RepID=A0A3N5AXK2_9THEO|nr:hypothetical protein EDD75_0579 [Thermodesulfitimonas autotrophica]
MFAKKCPHCNQWSYSAADIGDWYCPYCQHNLKDVPAVVPGAVEELERNKGGVGSGNRSGEEEKSSGGRET